MAGKPTPEFIEGLYEAMKARAASLAPHFTPGYGSKAMNADDEDVVWNRRKIPVEQEWELWRQKKPDGTPMFTPSQIGLMVFPDREKFAKSGGRVEPKDWITFANRTAQRMAAKREAQQQSAEMSAPPMTEGAPDDAEHP